MRRLSLVLFLLAGLLLLGTVASAQMVVPRNSSSLILIPAAGSLGGGGGTFFRSDLTLLNYRSSDQRVQLQWLPQGGGGSSTVFVNVSALSGVNSEDFVASVMQKSGLGAILITAVTSTGGSDPNAQLVATSRIWTPQPNATSGTNSQQFNGIPYADVNMTGPMVLVGHRRDDRYRTNVGIVNLDVETQSFRIDVLGSAGTQTFAVDVPAQSLSQVGLLGANSTLPLQIIVSNVTVPPRTTHAFVYGSSVDNVTGDAWSSFGYQQPASQP
jgi:hypothetical protein